MILSILERAVAFYLIWRVIDLTMFDRTEKIIAAAFLGMIFELIKITLGF